MRAGLLLVLSLLAASWPEAATMPSLDLASAAALVRAGACVSAAVDADGSSIYQAKASASGLDGSLKKHALVRDASGLPIVADAPAWDAASLLEARDPALRSIYTGQREGDRLRTIVFDWAALDQSGQALLSTGPDGTADAFGPARLAYLRGARGLEAGQPDGRFRRRSGLLGAAAAGAPLYVGPPGAAAADPRYPAFLAAHGRRPATVYLHANDGMLHAFDAASGEELFAYLPHALRPQWLRLPTAAHAASPYVEGGIAAGEALVRGAWKTVLVGAMGSGAQGIFALDVSHPARFAEGNGALFEFTDADDPDIGNIFGPPVLARFRTGTAQSGDFVVVASGYNSQRGDGQGRSNSAGPGVLFLLSLDKDPALPWRQNDNYFKIILPAASEARTNGLAPPALIADDRGMVRLAYAGDLQGQLWQLDFSELPPWQRASGNGKPLFAASDAGGNPQPITSQPRAVYRADGMLLLFGTGRLLEAADARDRSVQTLYAVAGDAGNAGLTRAQLAIRKLASDPSGAYRLEAGGGTQAGWLLDLPQPGERIVASPLVQNGMAYIATVLPGASACAADGRLYLLDVQTGLQPAGVPAPWLAMPAQPARTLNIVSDRRPGQQDSAGGRTVDIRDTVIGAQSGGAGATPAPSIMHKSRAGRMGWREVVNWEAMHNAAAKK